MEKNVHVQHLVQPQKKPTGCNCSCKSGKCACPTPTVNGKKCTCSTPCTTTKTDKCSCSCESGKCVCDKISVNGKKCTCSEKCSTTPPTAQTEKCSCSCSNGECQCVKDVLDNGKKCTCSKTYTPPPQVQEKCSCSCSNGNCQCDKDVLDNGQKCTCSQTCAKSDNCISRTYPNFEQCDTQWGSDSYSSKYTVCQVGCLVVAVANYMNGRGILIDGQLANPQLLNNYIRRTGGYINDYTFPFNRMSKLGLKYVGLQHDFSKIKGFICKGDLVALSLKKSPSTNNRSHFVLATGVNDDGSVNVNDGWTLDDRTLLTTVTTVQIQEYYVYQ